MKLLLQTLPMGRRLGAVLALLLLMTGLAAALSGQQSRDQQQQLAWLEQSALPSARVLQELSGQVDELRGLLALHLMLDPGSDADAMEKQMQLRRQAIEQGLAGLSPRVVDAPERRHWAAVSASLAAFTAEQDKLLAVSRQGRRDAGAVALARSLLVGPSQLAYQRLRADLAAWQAFVEQRSDQASRQARLAGASLAWQLTGVAVLLVGSAVLLAALLWWPSQAAKAGPATAPARRARDAWADWPRRRRLVDLAGSVERLAFEAHLLALNASVTAARQGLGGGVAPSVGREEGVRHLAQRVADATRELRQLLAGEAAAAGPLPTPAPADAAAAVAAATAAVAATASAAAPASAAAAAAPASAAVTAGPAKSPAG